MIKIIDVDKLFDEYISDYVYANIGKVSPDEIEDKMPILYNEFGGKPLEELDGKTPNDYYSQFSARELLDCLKGHLEKKIAVSDFLCEAIEKGDTEAEIVLDLNEENEEEYALYLLNFLSSKKSSLGVKRCLEMVIWDYSPVIRELATEILCDNAESVKEDILLQYDTVDQERKECLAEILVNVKEDDRVFKLLMNAFIMNPKKIPFYAGLLSKYGDDRAIEFLNVAAENEKVDYADFEEIRFAIEKLGGLCRVERDFSKDKTYKAIKNAKEDIFEGD